MQTLDRIIILDFGSQYTQLIARRVREMQVLAEILPGDTPFQKILTVNPKGLIISGGPGVAFEASNQNEMRMLFEMPIPILGICYGMQLMNFLHQGSIESKQKREYGKQHIKVCHPSPLFNEMAAEQEVWMSHGDHISRLAPGFIPLAMNHQGVISAFGHSKKPYYGLLFHPEVTHTINGSQILRNFLNICKCSFNWTVSNLIEEVKAKIKGQVGNGTVISLVSGGVDSIVATALCSQALGSNQVVPIYIDTGLMRQGETEDVIQLIHSMGLKNRLTVIHAGQLFLKGLEGISDPEAKRRIIGDLFILAIEEELKKYPEENTFICQGTLYTDLIESGKGCGQSAQVIKSHHNVNSPLIEEKRRKGMVVEPNACMFKDEVRQIGKALSISPRMLWRHPFPGPGLAIRIIGEVTGERLERLRCADAIFIEEITKAGLYNSIWQAFAILIPISTVGVMGDNRTTGHVIALRAVNSVDGMTANFFSIPYDLLSIVATRIINEVEGINRVVYDITSKPPGTIEWE